MPDQTLVDNIRKENYPLQIYMAFNNEINVIGITTKLTSFIQDVYRSLEPSHFGGNLIIYTTLDDSILLDEAAAIKFFDKNILINDTSDVLIFQVFNDDRLPLMWQNHDAKNVHDSEIALIYVYQDFSECFIANGTKIEIVNQFDCASIYALQYHYLSEALHKYKQEEIMYSSCSIFQKSWFDDARIYFKQQPEVIMQESLERHLKSALRGVDVVREYNLGASKPVDVRIYWKEANRAALIELKWLGQSKNDEGQLSSSYRNGRGNDGLDQLKEYMDLENQDTPTCITKGYLVIIDGRRRGLSTNPSAISSEAGIYYCNREINFAKEKKYFEWMTGFEKPLRMFVKPVCSS